MAWDKDAEARLRTWLEQFDRNADPADLDEPAFHALNYEDYTLFRNCLDCYTVQEVLVLLSRADSL